MNTISAFIPCSLYDKCPGFLRGIIHKTSSDNSNSFYIIDQCTSYDSVDADMIIGYYDKQGAGDFEIRKDNWINITLLSQEFQVRRAFVNGNAVSLNDVESTCIIYDHYAFLRSELLLASKEPILSGNKFEILTHIIKKDAATKEKKKPLNRAKSLVTKALHFLLTLVNIIIGISRFLQPILSYSTLGLHLHTFLESLSWSLSTSVQQRRLTLKVGNYIMASLADAFLGALALHWLLQLGTAASLHQLLLDGAEIVVATLRSLLHWLMGNPAGLKLNYALTNALGRFYLYHINLWWTFLVVAQPLLVLTFEVFLRIGRLGLSFQASILADLLALASFHVYCIYVYAARLFELQLRGLVALWRLFLGKKRNPLRDRVDSCRYSADQLFVGTLAFTVLLFLLPTTLLYYAVFTTLRLLSVSLGGLLTRGRFLLQAAPLYVALLWATNSPAVTNTVRLSVRAVLGTASVSVQPTSSRLVDTLRRCVPDCVVAPPPVQWGTLVAHLLTGRLVYPV